MCRWYEWDFLETNLSYHSKEKHSEKSVFNPPKTLYNNKHRDTHPIVQTMFPQNKPIKLHYNTLQ